MKIAHFAPYAPYRCGLYEAARDMVHADTLAGHAAIFVDAGITQGAEHLPSVVGAEDTRGGWTLRTFSHLDARDADVFVAHTGIPDNWIVRTTIPLIWILHGRPLACFRPEQNTRGVSKSYSLMADLAQWDRVRKMVTFWPEHVSYWDVIIPAEKLVCLPAPPIDIDRYTKDVPVHVFQDTDKGVFNILIADTTREDVDNFDIVHGAILAARRIPGTKIHFLAVEVQGDGKSVLLCWDHIFAEIRSMGALGEVNARVERVQEWYKACDLLMTPHRIATRTMAEAMVSGLSVVAGESCIWTPYTGIPEVPDTMADAALQAFEDLKTNRPAVKEQLLGMAEQFSLEKYSKTILPVYESVMKGA